MLPWTTIIYISEWSIRLVMLFVVTRSQRRVTSCLAWLGLIFFSPWVGLVFYGLLGRYRLPKRRSRRHARLLEEQSRRDRAFRRDANIVRPELPSAMMGTVRLAEKLGDMPILDGNTAELIAATDEVFDRVIRDIDAAEHHVHLLYYICGTDDLVHKVGEALKRAAARGVTCRVLIDAVGSRGAIKTLAPAWKQAGIEVHPCLEVGLFRRQVARIDLRNHRKLAIIDGRVAYTGSHNLIEASYGRKDLLWRDLTVRLEGPILLELQAVFEDDWYFQTHQTLDEKTYYPIPEAKGDIPAQTLPSGPNYPVENYQRMLVSALHSAGNHVVMTTPYFVPDDPFLQAIQTAAQRGVCVQIILPARSNHPLIDAASRSYYVDLLDAGVELYLFEDGLVHAKSVTIDETIAFLGTGNFDIRSFMLNFEINMLFYGRNSVCRLRDRQVQYLQRSRLLDAEEWANRPTLRRTGQQLARLLSPLL